MNGFRLRMKHKEIYKEYHEGKISLEEAWEKLKKLPKPWTTKEWKERKEEVIKESCEYCGSDSDLVIQHPPFKDKSKIIRQEVEEYFISKLDKRKLRVYAKELASELKKKSKEVYLCKRCRRSMQLTDKWTKYRCPSCKVKYDVNDVPATRAVKIINKYEPIDGQYARDTFRSRLERRKARELLWEQKDDVSRMVFEISFDMHEHYLSMENTKTLCKKCAYIEDKEAGLFTEEEN